MPLSALPSPHPSIADPKMGVKERCHNTEEVPEGKGWKTGRQERKDFRAGLFVTCVWKCVHTCWFCWLKFISGKWTGSRTVLFQAARTLIHPLPHTFMDAQSHCSEHIGSTLGFSVLSFLLICRHLGALHTRPTRLNVTVKNRHPQIYIWLLVLPH